jgi:hypothetical protein
MLLLMEPTVHVTRLVSVWTLLATLEDVFTLELTCFDLAGQLSDLILELAMMLKRGFSVSWILVQEPLENDRIQLQSRKYRV